MILVTQDYKHEIKALVRDMYARIEIDYTDTETDQSVNISFDDDAYTSYPLQIADGREDPSFKFASLDGTWVLDGSFHLAPDLKESGKYQFGLWGNTLSGAGGSFSSPYPLITIEFEERSVRSLFLVGDSKRNEWPADFEIRLYDEDGVIHTETVTNNPDVKWKKDIAQLNEVIKIETEIYKWSEEDQNIKIIEVLTSIQEVYENEDIISVKLIEEKETSQGGLPIGNIAANEIEIVLNNDDRRFDTGNRESRLHGYIKPNRKIRVWVGTESELVPLGVFWSKDWDVPEDDLKATTKGRDRLDRLIDSEYITSEMKEDCSLYDLAEDIFLDAGLNSDQYWIDPELEDFVVPYAYFLPVTHREALRQIALSCLGQIYCDREGKVRIEGPSFMEDKTQDVKTSIFLQSTFPAEIDVIEAYGISPEDYFRKDNPSRQEDVANHISVDVNSLTEEALQEIYKSPEPISIDANTTINVTVSFDEVPAIDVSISLTGVGAVVPGGTHIYAWGADVEIFSDTAGTTEITCTGKPLKPISKTIVAMKDDESILRNGLLKYRMGTNHLVQTQEHAEYICQTLLGFYKDPQRRLTMDWRGDPALELNDIVVTNDYFRGNLNEKSYYYITKQEMTYAKYFRTRMQGRRVI